MSLEVYNHSLCYVYDWEAQCKPTYVFRIPGLIWPGPVSSMLKPADFGQCYSPSASPEGFHEKPAKSLNFDKLTRRAGLSRKVRS